MSAECVQHAHASSVKRVIRSCDSLSASSISRVLVDVPGRDTRTLLNVVSSPMYRAPSGLSDRSEFESRQFDGAERSAQHVGDRGVADFVFDFLLMQSFSFPGMSYRTRRHPCLYTSFVSGSSPSLMAINRVTNPRLTSSRSSQRGGVYDILTMKSQ